MATLLNGKRLGLSSTEKKQYSISKAILGALSINPYSTEGIEGECHRAIYESLNPAQKAKTRGLLIPAGDLDWGGRDRRVSERSNIMNTGSFSQGGALVQTDHLGDSFVESLRNRSRVLSLGATMLPGRVGNVTIPKEASDTDVFWLSENEEIPETDQSFSQLSMKPRTVGAIASFSRNMLLSADPAIENILKKNMLTSLAIGVDTALLYGDGIKQPLGIFNTPGVRSIIAGNPDGGPLTYGLLTTMESEIFGENAEGNGLAWIVNSQIRKAARTTTENASSNAKWIWSDPIAGSDSMMGDGSMLGHKAVLSNNVKRGSTKGNGSDLSHLILGNWSSLAFASWGTIELMANPFGKGFSTGATELRVLYSVDSCVRYPESFCVCTDIDTAS